MTIPRSPAMSLLAACLSLGMAWGCGPATPGQTGPVGTPELREALFDSILAWTADRAAFSPIKNRILGFDPLEAMAGLRESVVNASSEEDLFYALHRLSNARRDRHLSVALVPGGLTLDHEAGLPAWDREEPEEPFTAPVRLLPDFSPGDNGFFIADVASGPGVGGTLPELGDRVVSVNGESPAALMEMARWYIRHSSIPGLRWKLAEALPLNTAILPPDFRGEALELETRKPDGSSHSYSLPYMDPGAVEWTDWAEPSYPGFVLESSNPTFDLYLPEDDRNLVLLLWHRFNSTLIQDMDQLMEVAQERGLLDRAVIFDATRSGGGSLGAYAVQRLQPRPFRTTFGTLQISDVIEPFVAERRAAFENRRVYDGDGPETVDDGTWLMDWLENEVLQDLADGKEVTEPVPFKLAHAPKDSDGILQPAPVHFRGPFLVFSGPDGGSHLDQFMSIVVDNELGPVFGMEAGGYSNTWEWEEVLHYPGTDQPVAGFMWNIGHTIRPNGEILEGNPASVTHRLPLTAENAGAYHETLLAEALTYLRSVGFDVGG